MSATAVGSGLVRGLTNVLLSNRQSKRDKAAKDEDRQHGIRLALFQKGIEEGLNPDELMAAIGFDLNFGEKPKKGAPDPNAILSQVLAPTMMGKAATGATPSSPAAASPNATGITLGGADAATQPGGDDPYAAPLAPLASRAAVTPVAQAEPKPVQRRTLFGMELPTEEEKAARAVALVTATEGAKLTAQTNAKMDQAARLRTIDPTMTVEDSLIAVGLKIPQDAFGTLQTGAGVYDKKTGKITEPPSAKTEKLTGALGERTRELMALHPDWDEPTARTEAAKAIEADREEDRTAKAANLESIRANRAIQHTLLKLQESQGGITPNNAAGLVTTLRKDWTKASEPFRTRETYVAKLNQAISPDKDGKTMIQRDRNAATQTVINSFNRLLEEGNAVREGEYRRSEELAPLTTWLEAQITALQSGGGRLTDAQLTSIAKEGIRIADATKSVHEEGLRDMRMSLEGQLKRYSIPSQDVFGSSTLGTERFSATLNGRTYSFDAQSKLDAFKRQFPDAK